MFHIGAVGFHMQIDRYANQSAQRNIQISKQRNYRFVPSRIYFVFISSLLVNAQFQPILVKLITDFDRRSIRQFQSIRSNRTANGI